eukprot:3975053-Pleurochrysis_carterae.AAC.2
MAALPYVNTHPVVERRTAQSESEWPRTPCEDKSYRRPTCWWWRRSGASHCAAEQADGVGDVWTRLRGAIKKRPDERLVGFEQLGRRRRAALGSNRGVDELWQVFGSRCMGRMNAGRCAVGKKRFHHVSDVEGLR